MSGYESHAPGGNAPLGLSRRTLLRGAAGFTGVQGLGALAACSGQERVGSAVSPSDKAVQAAEASRRSAGQQLVTARLTPMPATIDLGSRAVDTWAYGDSVPGPLLRARAGDLLRVEVANSLDDDTSVHWHGLALRNDMDGVPGITQNPIAAGGSFTYEFTAPDAGTYFYHPHSGVQLDRGLYGVLIVDEPHERGDYDHEWVVVLDDWVDGTGRTPDEVLAMLKRQAGTSAGSGMDDMSGMDGMDHGDMAGIDHGDMPMGGGMNMGGARSPLLGGAGDITYPLYLVNGRSAEAPEVFGARPGDRVRLRIVNAGSDTAFRIALAGHRMTVTHSDGFPVTPQRTDALLIGMGERYDVDVTLGDGVFPLVALAEGKDALGRALVRTGQGTVPPADEQPGELRRRVLLGTDLSAAPQARLKSVSVDRTHVLSLAGSMRPYRWTIGGKSFDESTPLPLQQGERVRLRFDNRSTMFYPMHVHGHTFALRRGGARKDTVIVRPRQAVEVELDADNPGQWATHCHNIYHAETGMMTTLSYQA